MSLTVYKPVDNKVLDASNKYGTSKTASVYIANNITAITLKNPQLAGIVSKVKSISLGRNVVIVGSGSFAGCTELVAIGSGSNVRFIEANAFSGCSKMTSCSLLANKLTRIGDNAFNGCTSLTGDIVLTMESFQNQPIVIGAGAF